MWAFSDSTLLEVQEGYLVCKHLIRQSQRIIHVFICIVPAIIIICYYITYYIVVIVILLVVFPLFVLSS